MKTKVVNLYEFDELSDKAKEKARDWWREHIFQDSCDWDGVYEDAIECGKRLGIIIGEKTSNWYNSATKKNGTSTSPSIFFSGFSCQGDGACFEGKYKYAEDAEKAIRDHAPVDEKLHRIGRDLDALQKKYKNSLSAIIKSGDSHYSHAYTMNVDAECIPDEGDDIEVTGEDQKALRELMCDFANWIYKQLETEHDYQNEDEVIDENIRANEYTFLENGKRED